jgi:hypothetical protein
VPLVGDAARQVGIGRGLEGLGRSGQRARVDAAAAQIRDGHAVGFEPRDRGGHEHADRLHAGGLELHVGLRAHVHARGPQGGAAPEPGPLGHVVEHRGPLDAGHRADHVRELLLDRDPQALFLDGAALPGAVALDRPPEAAAELAGQRLGIDEGPHVGALPRPRHPHAAILGAMLGELGAVERGLDDRQFRRRQDRARQQFDFLRGGPIADEPHGPADRRGHEPEGDGLRRREPRAAA